jgi:hypothetical protein
LKFSSKTKPVTWVLLTFLIRLCSLPACIGNPPPKKNKIHH